jgi:hypothetical protein
MRFKFGRDNKVNYLVLSTIHIGDGDIIYLWSARYSFSLSVPWIHKIQRQGWLGMQTLENQRYTATEPSQVLLLYESLCHHAHPFSSCLGVCQSSCVGGRSRQERIVRFLGGQGTSRSQQPPLRRGLIRRYDSQPLSLSSQCNRANANTMSTI